MKAVAVELRLELGEARVVLGDDDDDHDCDDRARPQKVVLGRDVLEALKEEIAPLLSYLKERAGGPVFAISVDAQKGSLVAAGGQGGVRLAGQDYADVLKWVSPLVAALGEHARKTVSS